MHDREQTRLLVIGPLGGAGIGKKPRDVRLAFDERRWRSGGKERVEFAVSEHVHQRLVVADRLKIESRDRSERRALMPARLLLPAAAPMNFRRQHAVFMLQHAAHPDHCRDLIFGHADAFAEKIRETKAGIPI
jgi:hypothetical protein